MESQPQNPEFRINPENFHPCILTKLSYSFAVVTGPVHLRNSRYIEFLQSPGYKPSTNRGTFMIIVL